MIGTQTRAYLNINNYAADPAYSPAGKTAMTLILDGDSYEFWKSAKERGNYKEEKQALAEKVIAALSEHIPETSGKVEVYDVATPLTYERYCGNWKGSWMTEMTPSINMDAYPCTIDGLSGIYFAGQRMMPPGGLPVALSTGRTAVQHLCRDTDTIFVSEK
jgi:phytoene dehydrogenase-like protein